MRESNGLWVGLKRLFGHLSKRRKRQLYALVGLMILGAIGELVTLGALLPFLALLSDPGKAASYPMLQSLFAALGWSDPTRILLPVTLLFAAVALGAGAIRMLLTWLSQRFVFQVAHEFGVEVYRRTLCQPYQYHISKNTSELLSAVDKLDLIVYGALVQLMQVITAVILSTFIVAALVLIDPLVAVSAGMGFGAVYLAVTLTMRRRLEVNSKIWADSHSDRLKALQEGLGGIRDILIDQTQNVFIDKFRDIDATLRRVQAANYFIGVAPRYAIEACGTVLIAAIAYALSQSPGGLMAALPVLGALALGAQRLLPQLQVIYNGWASVAAVQEALLGVFDILDLPIDARYEQSTEDRPIPFKHKISLDSVSFRYSGNHPDVLHNISLSIPKGARMGFIGKTGSGKSTIIDLVMGLLNPTSGMIRIDDIALTAKNVRGWQAQIAHVPQAIYLADTTIAENIAFGVPEQKIDYNRIREAARGARLDGFIEDLADGYRTIVGERGVRLSGGQRQRIGIARALYKRARVLVFDEATSALDNVTEAAVMEAIQSLGRDLTILMIAHRLSTVAICDTVIKLDAGQMVIEGPPATVIGAELTPHRHDSKQTCFLKSPY